MMGCRRARARLAESWGTGAPLDDASRRHVLACRTCSDLAADLPEILDLARTMGAPEPKAAYWDEFSARVRQRIRREADPMPGSPLGGRRLWPADRLLGLPSRSWLPATVAAAAAVVAVLVWSTRGPAGPRRDDLEMTGVQSHLESRIRIAGDEARTRAADLLATFDPEGDPDWRGGEGAPPSVDDASADEALGNVIEILSPAGLGGLPDAGAMTEGLTGAQIRKLMQDIGSGPSRGALRKSEVRTG